MTLYGIFEDEVALVLERKAGQSVREGRAAVVDDDLAGKHGYPLKEIYNYTSLANQTASERLSSN